MVCRPAYEVAESDKVVFRPPARPNYQQQIDQFAKQVIYQDDNVVVINKPAGMLVHAKGGIAEEFTVADFVRSLFNPAELATAGDNNRLGIVHRLDRATSGVMICARNLTTQALLARQFAERRAHKTYLAVTEHAPANSLATIDLPIGRNLSRPATFRVDPHGKSAVTDYRILAINPAGQALWQLQPRTGRTHQLRVHLAYLGCPIVGDPVYGRGRRKGRLMLHAWKLEISIPGTDGRKVRRTFIAPIPTGFLSGFEGICDVAE